MSLQSIIVKAIWDADAGVWVATSDDLPGLVAEADTTENLEKQVHAVIEDLLDLNGYPEGELPAEIPLHIVHHQTSKIRTRAT
ncbi:MAG: DUF1902 domain-containing protein [Proteobacteria bacterium]|nr:DUF1902 domain-containing protein [Pseudomonadota bacterium]